MTPKQTENLKLGGAVIGSLAILYLLFGNKKDNSGASSDPTGNGSTSTPAGSTFNAKNVAETLYDAMKDIGTDEDAILEALKYVNTSQFTKVETAFGKRAYNAAFGNIINFSPFYDLPLLPLKTWLKEELSTADYAILRNKYPNQL